MRFIIIISCLLIVSSLSKIFSQDLNLQWAKQMGGSVEDIGNSVVVDESGNVYTTGTFQGTADFDPGPGTYNLTASGSGRDIFISKLNNSGNFLWAKRIGGSNSNDYCYSITLDNNGNVYTTGSFTGTADFDPGPGIYNLISTNSDIFVLKLDSVGNFLWAKQLGGPSFEEGSSITNDINGNVYSTGNFLGTVDFDPGPGTYNLTANTGIFKSYISKLDASGNFIWAKELGGPGDAAALSITVDANENVYSTGYFTNTADFDPGPGIFNLTSASSGPYDIFISKLDATGNFIWAKGIGGLNNDRGFSIVVDAIGNLYATGYFLGTVDFDPGPGVFNLNSSPSKLTFILKLNSLGDFVWAKNIGGTNVTGVRTDISLDDQGFVYTSGVFGSTEDFDPGPGIYNLTAVGGYDVFISKLNSFGNFIWAKSMGGSNDDFCNSNNVDASGNVYLTGYFNGTSNFDPGPGSYNLTSFGNKDIFVAKYDQGNLCTAVNVSTQPQDQTTSVGSTATFNVAAGGSPPFIYQWKKNGVNISGANSDSHTTPVLILTDNGTIYSCDITNCTGNNSVTSNNAILTVNSGCIIPTSQASNISFSSVGTNQLTVNWLNGNGSRRVVKISTSNTFTSPANGTDPTSNSVYSGGEQVVYNGSGNSATITGLTPGTMYWFRVYEANCSGSSSFYNVSFATNNPSNQTTQIPMPTVNSLIGTNVILNHPNISPDFTFYNNNNPYTNNAPIQICADGSTATYLKVNVSNTSLISFKILDESGNEASDIRKYGQLGPVNIFGNNVEVAYTHPEYMDANRLFRPCTLQIVYNDIPIPGISIPLNIYRAPILFMHGFVGDRSTFEEMENTLLYNIKYPPIPNSPLIHRAHYFSTSMDHFYRNRKVVPKNIDLLFTKLRNQHYSSGKVIVFSHSMGGVLSRLYLQSRYGIEYRDDIAKLITANTPHYGTQFANWGTRNIQKINGILDILGYPIITIPIIGAIWDMRVNSFATKHELNIPQGLQNKVPSVTLSSDQIGDNARLAKAIRTYLNFNLTNPNNIFHGDASDLIVPMSSQRSGILRENIIPQQWHVGSCANTNIMVQIESLIDADPLDINRFTTYGFPTATLQPPFFLRQSNDINSDDNSRTAAGDSIKIIRPASGQSFNQNDNVNVGIYNAGNITHMALITYGNSINPITIDTTNVNQLNFQIPANAVGKLKLVLLGGDSTTWFIQDSIHIFVTPNSIADSIRTDPELLNLPLGLTTTVDVKGYFNGMQTGINLIDAPGLTVQFDPAILSYDNNRIFKGLAIGTTNVIFSYQGKSDTTFFTIVNDPSVLTASFDYSSDRICVNNSVTFEDNSLGLAIGYEWSFPGGIPSSSTLPNPVVFYSTPGFHSAGLKTYFVNGVDSIVIDSLIYVNQLPNATITAGGSTTICSGDSVTLSATTGMQNYLWSNGDTTSSIVVTSSGNYSVTVKDSLGCSATSQLITITVKTIPIQPGIINGNNSVCLGTPQNYSVAPVPGADSYTWTFPSGWTGTSNTNSITATVGASSGTILVKASNSCGSSTEQLLSVSVNATPAQPGVMSGNNIVCQNTSQTYSVADVPGATSYTWTLPSGWTGTSTTYIITVTPGPSSGTILVRANNSCGNSSDQTLSVTVNSIPVQPGTIIGSSNTCQSTSQNYSVAAVPGATSYTWTLPSGWTGTSTTNSITVTAGANSGNILVKANNSCGSSSDQILSVTVNSIPVQPGTITGSSNTCQSTSQNYSVAAVPGATSYTWTLPSGWTGTSTTNTITAIVGTSSGSILVKANTSCGSSTNRSLNVTVNPGPSINLNSSAEIYLGGRIFLGNRPVSSGLAPLSYKWTPSDGLSPSDTIANPIASPHFSTIYTLKVTDKNGCYTTKSIDVSVIGFYVFPNPTSDIIKVYGSKIENGEYLIKVIDMYGKVLVTKRVQVNARTLNEQLSIGNFPNAMYVVLIEGSNLQTPFKIIKTEH